MDEELELVFPCKEMQKEIEEYRQEFFDNGELEIAGDAGLDRIPDFDEWLKKVQNDVVKEFNENDNIIPATVYFTVRKLDNKIVGNVQIRHKLSKKLFAWGGHIGDSVRPSERKKGYATKQIGLALKKCKELKINSVLLDCDKENIGSAKAIQNNGGVLENEVYIDGKLVQRYWISLKKRFANREIGEKRYDLKYDVIHKMKSVKSDIFTGDIHYMKFNNVTQKFVLSTGLCILDENYEWLEFYDYNSNVKLTAMFDENRKNVEWYFDIARCIGKENGVPYEDDLYLDVVVSKDGKISLLDEDELQVAFDKFEVNQKDFDMAYDEANKLLKKLEGNFEKLKEFSYNYLDEMNAYDETIDWK